MIKLKKVLIGIAAIAIICILIIVAVVIPKNYIKPSSTENDIVVEGVLQPNKTGVCDYKEYMLNIKMVKNKDCHVIIYPYIKGLGDITFSEKDKVGYYLPDSIGSDGITEPIAINKLKNINIIENESNVSLAGFWFQDSAGKYKARAYLGKTDNFTEIKNPLMVCVYTEKKFGKLLTWAKVVPITVNQN